MLVSLNGPIAREAANIVNAYHVRTCEASPSRSEPWACGASPSIPKVGPSPANRDRTDRFAA
jgi:hypothetical protein